MDGQRECGACSRVLPVTHFYESPPGSGKRHSNCKDCHAANTRAWRLKNPQRNRDIGRASAARNREKRRLDRLAYYRTNRAKVLKKQKDYFQQLKDAAYARYGGYRCACCGETEKKFLNLDHINNDGATHRKAMGNGGRGQLLYGWLKAHGYPPILQVLCANCNQGKKLNGGVCPHQAAGQQVLARYGLEIEEL